MDSYVAIEMDSVPAEDLVGTVVYDSSDSNIGEIGELTPAGAVVDVGGFIGIGEKHVLLDIDRHDADAGNRR